MTKRIKVIPPVIQPKKCRKCVWGRWAGSVQFCTFATCVKEEKQNPKRLGF